MIQRPEFSCPHSENYLERASNNQEEEKDGRKYCEQSLDPQSPSSVKYFHRRRKNCLSAARGNHWSQQDAGSVCPFSSACWHFLPLDREFRSHLLMDNKLIKIPLSLSAFLNDCRTCKLSSNIKLQELQIYQGILWNLFRNKNLSAVPGFVWK